MVEWLFLAVPRGCLQFLIVVFPDHTHLLFSCGVAGDAIHYFYHCRRYTTERQGFNDTVRLFQHLSTSSILFDDENWNFENNIVLFRAV